MPATHRYYTEAKPVGQVPAQSYIDVDWGDCLRSVSFSPTGARIMLCADAWNVTGNNGFRYSGNYILCLAVNTEPGEVVLCLL